MGRTTGTSQGAGRGTIGDLEDETSEEALSELIDGAARVHVSRLAPLTFPNGAQATGYLGQFDYDPARGVAELESEIQRSYGGGRYKIRPIRPDGKFGKGTVTVRIAGDPVVPSAHAPSAPQPVAAMNPAAQGQGAAALDPGLVGLLREALLGRGAAQPQQPSQGLDLQNLIQVARLLNGGGGQQAPIDLTAVLTAILQQQRHAADPVGQLAQLIQVMPLLRGEASAEEEPRNPEDRMFRMMEMMMMSRMMGGMGGPQGGGGGVPPEMMAMMGGNAGQWAQAPQQRQQIPPGAMAAMMRAQAAQAARAQPAAAQPAAAQPAQAPPWPPQAAQAEEDEDWLPNPMQLVGDLAEMDDGQRAEYLGQVFALLQMQGLVPNVPPPSAAAPAPVDPAAGNGPPGPVGVVAGTKLTGGGF